MKKATKMTRGCTLYTSNLESQPSQLNHQRRCQVVLDENRGQCRTPSCNREQGGGSPVMAEMVVQAEIYT